MNRIGEFQVLNLTPTSLTSGARPSFSPKNTAPYSPFGERNMAPIYIKIKVLSSVKTLGEGSVMD
jgi:hypothetical protein